jgi:hypothetical protein
MWPLKISTSGARRNIIRALEDARKRNMLHRLVPIDRNRQPGYSEQTPRPTPQRVLYFYGKDSLSFEVSRQPSVWFHSATTRRQSEIKPLTNVRFTP